MDRLSRLLVGLSCLVTVSFSQTAIFANDAKIASPEGGEIRAFVIGIDAYQNVRKLKGAAADARDIEATLRGMGVRDVTTLIDEQAERSVILRDISSLVSRTNPNDLIFLSIAGHGTQEPERTKGSNPDGMENVFLLPAFEPTATGSSQRVLSSEFNHFIKQFELRGAKVIFVADTCHGGGMARNVDPRAEEMSFRQVAPYKLVVDTLQPVTKAGDVTSDLDLDRTAFLAAVDRSTKSPEIRVPGVEGLRGALSYAVSRAIEGTADADNDGRITLKELFANVRQVVYQLSDQRQTVVAQTSTSGQLQDTETLFSLTRGIAMVKGGDSPATKSQPTPLPPSAIKASPPPADSRSKNAASPQLQPLPESSGAPIRLAALDGGSNYFSAVISREVRVQTVQPSDNPDLIWDPVSRDIIAWGDVVSYGVEAGDLASVIDRTVAVRDLKSISTRSPQAMRILPDDQQYRRDQTVEINLSDMAGKALVLFNISGDGTVQMLYPRGSDESPLRSADFRLRLRVRGPFGADQVVAITSSQRSTELEQAVLRLDRRRAPRQAIRALQMHTPADARIGSIGFFSAP